MIRRREFVTLLGGTAAWPLAARAQQRERMRRIGVLQAGDENDPVAKAYLSAFRTFRANRKYRPVSPPGGPHLDRRRAIAVPLI